MVETRNSNSMTKRNNSGGGAGKKIKRHSPRGETIIRGFERVPSTSSKSSATRPPRRTAKIKLPDPEYLLSKVNNEIKEMKMETKELHGEWKLKEEELLVTKEDAKEISRKVQIAELKGRELFRLENLRRMGFDEEIIKEHLEKDVKRLEKELKKKRQDVKNIEANIKKMIAANKESERVVTSAQGTQGQLLVQNQKLRTMLDQAEVQVYAEETKVKQRTSMKDIKIVGKRKNSDLTVLKDIVKLIQHECTDKVLVRDVVSYADKVIDGTKSTASSRSNSVISLASSKSSADDSSSDDDDDSDSSSDVDISSASSSD